MSRRYIITFETDKWIAVESIAAHLRPVFQDDPTNVTIDKYQGCSGSPVGVYMDKYSDTFLLP